MHTEVWVADPFSREHLGRQRAMGQEEVSSLQGVESEALEGVVDACAQGARRERGAGEAFDDPQGSIERETLPIKKHARFPKSVS